METANFTQYQTIALNGDTQLKNRHIVRVLESKQSEIRGVRCPFFIVSEDRQRALVVPRDEFKAFRQKVKQNLEQENNKLLHYLWEKNPFRALFMGFAEPLVFSEQLSQSVQATLSPFFSKPPSYTVKLQAKGTSPIRQTGV